VAGSLVKKTLKISMISIVLEPLAVRFTQEIIWTRGESSMGPGGLEPPTRATPTPRGGKKRKREERRKKT
jgi:hypothetical protein